MKVGFIGLNQLGSQLIHSFLQAQTFMPTEVIVYDKDLDKANAITSKYPGCFAARHSRELIEEVTCIFLCIDECDYPTIKKAMQTAIKPSHFLISLVPSIQLAELEMDFPCKVAKIETTPHLSSIVSFLSDSRTTHAEKHMIQQLFSTIYSPQKNVTVS